MMSNLRDMLNTWDEADSELNKKIDNTNLSSIVASATASATNSKTVEINGTGKNVEKLVVEGKAVQDGTPSPDNPIEVKGVGDYDEETGKYKIPISVGDTTKNVYLDAPLFDGEKADVVSGVADKKWGMVVVDNNSAIGRLSDSNVYHISIVNNVHAMCDRLIEQNSLTSVASSGGYHVTGQYIYFNPNKGNTIDEVKAWLKDNPITFVYGLTSATKETFEAAELPTTVEKNILSVDTDVIPASIGAVTFGDYYSKAEVDKKIGEWEETIVTFTNTAIDTLEYIGFSINVPSGKRLMISVDNVFNNSVPVKTVISDSDSSATGIHIISEGIRYCYALITPYGTRDKTIFIWSAHASNNANDVRIAYKFI